MENVTQETILYKVEARIAAAKEEKIKLLGEHKEDNNLNAKITSLVLIKSELIRENKNNKEYHLSSDDEIALLSNMAEKRKQNIKDYTRNGRLELAEADAKELALIKEFLPYVPEGKELEDFINSMIDAYLSEQTEGYAPSMKDMGKIKTLVNATYPTVNGGIIKDVLMNRIKNS